MTDLPPPSTIILGVDPGVKGALAFINVEACILVVKDMPTFTVTKTKTKHKVEAVQLGDHLRRFKPTRAFIEEVHASPQMGVVSAFSFGDSYGALRGALAALSVPLDEVRPQEWKKAMRVPADKKEAKARAIQLMPACSPAFKRPDHAEAAILALYGCLMLGFTPKQPLVLFNAD